MVFVDGDADVLAKAQLLAQVVVLEFVIAQLRFAPETDVDLLGAQRFVLHVRPGLVQRPRHAREFGLELFEQARDRSPHRRADDADPQPAHFAAVDLADGVDRHAHLGQQFGCLHHQRLAGHRQFERAGGAGEQFDSQLALELHDLLAQRRLRNMQPFGRAREALFFRNGEEVFQLFQVDGHGVFQSDRG